MNQLRDEYLKMINFYKTELKIFSQEKAQIKAENEFYPTRSLDVKIADRKRKLKMYMEKYEETYRVQI